MTMPGKSGGSEYRFGFQGQEEDDEIKGDGNSVNYKCQMYDSRIGRFFAVDPLAYSYPYNSPYAFSENKVIAWIEFEGLESLYNSVKDMDGKTIKVINSEDYSPIYTIFLPDESQVIVYQTEAVAMAMSSDDFRKLVSFRSSRFEGKLENNSTTSYKVRPNNDNTFFSGNVGIDGITRTPLSSTNTDLFRTASIQGEWIKTNLIAGGVPGVGLKFESGVMEASELSNERAIGILKENFQSIDNALSEAEKVGKVVDVSFGGVYAGMSQEVKDFANEEMTKILSKHGIKEYENTGDTGNAARIGGGISFKIETQEKQKVIQ